ncbi:MAG: DNA-directed RNA polymerase subunit H [Thermosphaera sp.]|nr:DNA-directed RNA polymerase subunit H [Thermosphaera sp.]
MEEEINILEHELVPRHEVVPPQEALELLRKLGIEPWQLPWISADDPVVKAIGAKPGDIIRIIRKSPTAGEFIAYRYVVVEVTKKS